MKTCLVKLSLIAGGAALASHAGAQALVPPGKAAAPAALAAPESAPAAPAVTVAANARASLPKAAPRRFVAAGSVIVLVDGVVASASFAQVHAPAAGFEYER